MREKLRWTKAPPEKKGPSERWLCRPLPDGSLTLTVFAKGDGRFVWECYAEGALQPMASGIVGSLAAAKSVSVNFLERAGRL